MIHVSSFASDVFAKLKTFRIYSRESRSTRRDVIVTDYVTSPPHFSVGTSTTAVNVAADASTSPAGIDSRILSTSRWFACVYIICSWNTILQIYVYLPFTICSKSTLFPCTHLPVYTKISFNFRDRCSRTKRQIFTPFRQQNKHQRWI